MGVYRLENNEHIEEILIRCNCHSNEHQFHLSFMLDEKPSWDEFYFEPYLATYYNFFHRIWVAIKYVFGWKSRYGPWDCVSIDREDVVKIVDFMRKFIDLGVRDEKNKR